MPYTSISLAQFTTLVQNRLGGASTFWTSDEIRQNINAALRTWNCLTGYWKTRLTFNASVNVPYYALPASLVFGARVEIDGVPAALGSVFSWDQDDPNWMFKRDKPEEWTPVGLGIIGLRPIPSSNAFSVLVDGVTVTPTLTVAGDKIDIGQEEFQALLDYIQHVLSFKEGGQEFQSTMPAYQRFIAAAGVRNEKLRASAFYRHAMGVDRDLQLKQIRSALSVLSRNAANEVGVR
jgi:hypothetical protein